jgi:phosphomannomutase/phosphoglucomutase
MDYNGMKLVRDGARPISGDTGLRDIEALADSGHFAAVSGTGKTRLDEDKSAYINHLLSYVDRSALRPLKIVVNAGNGGAGVVIDQLAPYLPFDFVRIHHAPDGSFPHGIPNPLLPESREATAEAVRSSGADFGIAWDGDFDRCFFFDGDGQFIEGYYLVGLLAVQLLEKSPGGKIVHDPRLTWNTIDMVRHAGGAPVLCKTGHAFIKERMRVEDAVYGGEMSAHHYFRDFAYCDSGMIPWLLIAERVSRSGLSLASLVEAQQRAYPCSGEINFRVTDAPDVIDRIMSFYRDQDPRVDTTDGISLEFAEWRFNLRVSNTEPLLRLNVESRKDEGLLQLRLSQLKALIEKGAQANSS